ncbi:hypothetical protein [Mycobacterium sp.]|uniref:hypothetical protein n=1 Tax=Mycobacterium sp. TaxID=1785 RepID=UPI002D2E8E22|nr:hypothetical protein [Mycobacterium sp.]HZA09076.1 hypothetical protein [Mycobacterium sp.]
MTAHSYADLFDDELANIAAALDLLDDLQPGTTQLAGPWPHSVIGVVGPYWPHRVMTVNSQSRPMTLLYGR